MNINQTNAALPLIRPGATQSAAAASAGSAAASANAAATDAKAAPEDPSERFLKLLVAQMRNQDPMNPLDNAQVTSQMAQISTVQGVEKLNASMQKWMTQSSAVQQLEGAALIGKRVLVPGDSIELAGGADRATAARGGFSLDAAATSVKVEVLDAAGNTVATLSQKGVLSGSHSFEWDGRDDAGKALPDGRYGLRVTAGDASSMQPVQALRAVAVSAVLSSSEGARLELSGAGQVAVSDVKAIL